jgi:hypothetical protein
MLVFGGIYENTNRTGFPPSLGREVHKQMGCLLVQHTGEEKEQRIKQGESRTHIKLPTGMYQENNTVSSLKVMHCKKYFDK